MLVSDWRWCGWVGESELCRHRANVYICSIASPLWCFRGNCNDLGIPLGPKVHTGIDFFAEANPFIVITTQSKKTVAVSTYTSHDGRSSNNNTPKILSSRLNQISVTPTQPLPQNLQTKNRPTVLHIRRKNPNETRQSKAAFPAKATRDRIDRRSTIPKGSGA